MSSDWTVVYWVAQESTETVDRPDVDAPAYRVAPKNDSNGVDIAKRMLEYAVPKVDSADALRTILEAALRVLEGK